MTGVSPPEDDDDDDDVVDDDDMVRCIMTRFGTSGDDEVVGDGNPDRANMPEAVMSRSGVMTSAAGAIWLKESVLRS
jgi:hypothetical protein